MFLKKAGSLERTAFAHSSMQQINKTLWVLWKCSDTLQLIYYYYYLFIEKVKQKYFFSSNTFQFIKKAWTWAKWTVVSAFSLFIENGCNFNIKTLKPSLTEQGFFSFFFSMVTVLDLNKIMKFLKLGEYYI